MRWWAALLSIVSWPSIAWSQTVTTAAELETAVRNARAGDEIILEDGTYVLNGELRTVGAGTAAERIVVRARNRGGAIIESNGAAAAFRIVLPYWTFDGLHVRVTGNSLRGYWMETNGQNIEVLNGRIEVGAQAEAAIKASGGATAPQPDFGRIEGNEIWFPAPTTYLFAEGIDAVAVDGWVIRGNVIHGVRQATGGIGYGALTKGNSLNTIIEDNLFYDNFIAISLGAGGTDPQFLRNQDTSYEDRNGIIRNNVVINSDDVAIYLFFVDGAKVYNNTIVDSFTTCGAGCSAIDIRFDGDADIRNNILDKPLNDREGGRHTEGANLMLPPGDRSWFVDPGQRDYHLRPQTPPVDSGEALADVPADFDGEGRPSGAGYDVGADEVSDGTPPRDGGTTVTTDAGEAPTGMGDRDRGPSQSGGCACRTTSHAPWLSAWLVVGFMRRRRR